MHPTAKHRNGTGKPLSHREQVKEAITLVPADVQLERLATRYKELLRDNQQQYDASINEAYARAKYLEAGWNLETRNRLEQESKCQSLQDALNISEASRNHGQSQQADLWKIVGQLTNFLNGTDRSEEERKLDLPNMIVQSTLRETENKELKKRLLDEQEIRKAQNDQGIKLLRENALLRDQLRKGLVSMRF